MKIFETLEPFIELGYVTVVSSNHTGIEPLDENDREEIIAWWLQVAKPLCKWGSVTNSDEFWFPLDQEVAASLSKLHINEDAILDKDLLENDRSGVNQLIDLLEYLEDKHKTEKTRQAKLIYSQPRFGVTEAYHETKISSESATLLDSYPRSCYYNRNRMLWAKLSDLDRIGACSVSPTKMDVKYIDYEDSQYMFVIRYSMRSVEEELFSLEQSYSQGKRELSMGPLLKCNSDARRSYDDFSKAKGHPQRIPFAKRYHRIVSTILSEWPTAPKLQNLPPDRQDIKFSFNGTANWELYSFFKWISTSQYSWDDTSYLYRNEIDLEGTSWEDGLHHFVEVGFFHGLPACLRSKEGKTFCTDKAQT